MLDLDALVLAHLGRGEPPETLANEVPALLKQDAWIAEGAYLVWTRPLLEAADMVVWLQVSWLAASYRIVVRHIKAEIARNNRFPGWRRLYRFWAWQRRHYANRNPAGPNEFGVPSNLGDTGPLLEPFADKVVIWRNNRDVKRLVRDVSDL